MDIAMILSHKYLGSEWSLAGNDYAGLTWLSDTPKPTEKALEALWPTVQYEIAYEQIEKIRKQAYTEISDPLFFKYQEGTATKEEWLESKENIRIAHPYPEKPEGMVE
jgi:hypothetical protein